MGNDTDPGLSDAEIHDLRSIAATMIPEDRDLGMPGANDPIIQTDLVKSLGRDFPLVREAVAAIARKSGGTFAGMTLDRREALIDDYYAGGGAAAATLGRVILAAYYRDDRVLLALGLEARAPFPKGHTLEQGDWSLLDAVRQRPPFWRDDRTTPDGER
jgi:hypothetical protein